MRSANPLTLKAPARRRTGFRVPLAVGAALLVLQGWVHADYGLDQLTFSTGADVEVCKTGELNVNGDFIGFDAADPSTCVTFTRLNPGITPNNDGSLFGFHRWQDGVDYETAVIADGYRIDSETANGRVLSFGAQTSENRSLGGKGEYGLAAGRVELGGPAWVGGVCSRFGVDLLVNNFDSQIVTGPYDLVVRINTAVAFDASKVARTGGADGLGPSSLADVPYETTIRRNADLYEGYSQRDQETKFVADDYRFESIVPDASGDVTYAIPQNTFADEECVFGPGPDNTSDSLTLTVDLAPRALAGGFDAVSGAIEGSVSSSDGTDGSVTVSGGFDVQVKLDRVVMPLEVEDFAFVQGGSAAPGVAEVVSVTPQTPSDTFTVNVVPLQEGTFDLVLN